MTNSGDPKDYLCALKVNRNQNARNMIITHLNINSIRYKVGTIHSILNDNLVDVFAITETKIDASFPDEQFKVSDFSLHRCDRTNRGGGVAVYVRSAIPHCHSPDIDKYFCEGVEGLTIECTLNHRKMFIITMYKPPNVPDNMFNDVFRNVYENVSNESNHIVILGDLNFNMLLKGNKS